MPGRTGFAHLFEHLMFQGSKNVPGEYFSLIERWARTSARAASTAPPAGPHQLLRDRAVGNLETLLWLEADRMATLLDETDQKKLDNQRDVVKNERRQGVDNQPYGRAYELLVDELRAGRAPVLVARDRQHGGSDRRVARRREGFLPQLLRAEQPELVIAGDFNPAEAKRLVEKYFGGLTPGPALDRPRRWLPVLERRARGRGQRSRAGGAQLRRLHRAGVLRRRRSGDAITARILGDGLSSRLEKALIYDKPLASEVNVGYDPQEIAGGFVVIADGADGVPLPDLEQVISASCTCWPARADPGRARSRPDQAGVPVHLGARAHRRLRRKGRPAEPVQHLPRRSRQIRGDLGRYRALPSRMCRKLRSAGWLRRTA